MYVFMYVCIYVYRYICIYVYMYICMYIHVFAPMYLNPCIQTCVYTITNHIYIYVCVCVINMYIKYLYKIYIHVKQQPHVVTNARVHTIAYTNRRAHALLPKGNSAVERFDKTHVQ